MDRTRRVAAPAEGVARQVLKAYQTPASETFIMDGSVNSPEWYASRVSIPPRVNADGIVDVVVEVANEKTVITPLNNYVCRSGLFSGLESFVEVNPRWTAESESTELCTQVGGFSPTIDTFTADFVAPSEPGTYDIDVTVETFDGSEGGTVTYQILVEGDDDDAGDRPGDGGDDRGGSGDTGGGGGDNDGGIGSGGGLLGTEQTIALAAFTILVLIAFNVSR